MSAIYVDRVGGTHPAENRESEIGNRKSARAYPAEGTAPLSNEQKAALCIRAREAFIRVHGRDPHDGAELETWRRGEQEKATGKPSLTLCTQADYLPLLGKFADLAGESGVAMNAHVRSATSERRLAMHKLREACAQAGLALSYPAAICRTQNKCALEDATAKQLWRLVFTVRNRAAKKARQVSGVRDQESEASPKASAPPPDSRPPTPGFKTVGKLTFKVINGKAEAPSTINDQPSTSENEPF